MCFAFVVMCWLRLCCSRLLSCFCLVVMGLRCFFCSVSVLFYRAFCGLSIVCV